MQFIPDRTIRSSGDQELRNAQACRCEHLADELGNDLAYQRESLTPAKVAEVRARIDAYRAEAVEWRLP